MRPNGADTLLLPSDVAVDEACGSWIVHVLVVVLGYTSPRALRCPQSGSGSTVKSRT